MPPFSILTRTDLDNFLGKLALIQSDIAGTRDAIVLCARPLANNGQVEGALN